MDVKITETVPAAQMYAKIPEICKTFSIGATLARRLSDEMHASRKWKKYVIKMDHLTLVNIDGALGSRIVEMIRPYGLYVAGKNQRIEG